MELSPQQIRNIGFKLVKKGYDPDQVDAFKDDMAAIVETAHNQATAMEARARAAVAKLHEVSQNASAAAPAPARAQDSFSASDSEVITRTLALAQRTADTAIAEARSEADEIVAQSREEAERLLDNARTLAAKTIEDSRAEARRAVEGDRVHAENELQSLLARRDFLLSDVDHLEQYLQAQRERLRDAANALQEMVERVPAGLGEIRRPLLSASAESAVVTPTHQPALAPRREPAVVEEAAPEFDLSEASEVHASMLRDDDTHHSDGSEDGDNDPDTGYDKGNDRGGEEELSELIWDDASIAAAERASELPFRPSGGPPQRPGSRPPSPPRRGPGSPFNDQQDPEDVWRLLDEEVAHTQAAEAGLHIDEITTEVPIIPRTADTFRVGGDELQ